MSNATTDQPQIETLSFDDFVPTEPLKAPEPVREAAPVREAVQPAAEKPSVKLQGTLTDAIEELKKELKEETVNKIKATVAKPEAKAEPAVEAKVEKAQDAWITAETTDEEITSRAAANKNLTAAQLKAFKELSFDSRENKRNLKEIAALREKIKTAENNGSTETLAALQKEREALAKRIDEQETELAATRYRKTQAYQNEIAKPMQEIGKEFHKKEQDWGIAEGAIEKAASLRGKARSEALSELTVEMDDFEKSELYGLVKRYAELAQKDCELEAMGRDRWNQWQAEQQERQQQEAAARKAEFAGAIKKTWEEKMMKALPFLEKTEDPELKAAVEKGRQFAETAEFQRFDPEGQAEILHRAALFPAVLSELRRLEAEVIKLSGHNRALKGAAPNGESRVSGGVPASSSEEEDKNMTLSQSLRRFRNEMGLP